MCFAYASARLPERVGVVDQKDARVVAQEVAMAPRARFELRQLQQGRHLGAEAQGRGGERHRLVPQVEGEGDEADDDGSPDNQLELTSEE